MKIQFRISCSFILGLLVMCFSCERDDAVESMEFFPLHVGDEWYYDNDDTCKIVALKEINGKHYYQMSNSETYHYYRVESGKVYALSDDFEEYVRFNFNLNDGDSWEYKSGSLNQFTWRANIGSTSDTLIMSNYRFTRCYLFCYDIPEIVDEEHCIYVAPGVGIVRKTCGECLHPVTDLVWAKIDGKVVTGN